jgi:hypothetical protein
MSWRSAEVPLKFGDGEYLFSLKLKQIEELQQVCKAGLGTIAKRAFNRDFYVEDIYHTIRLALIGGGLAPVKAKQIVDHYVDGCPIDAEGDPASPVKTMLAIFDATWFGVAELAKDDPPGEAKAGTTADSSTSRP